eukprot:1608531-Heterocapsa_arctica.AAC.1
MTSEGKTGRQPSPPPRTLQTPAAVQLRKPRGGAPATAVPPRPPLSLTAETGPSAPRPPEGNVGTAEESASANPP